MIAMQRNYALLVMLSIASLAFAMPAIAQNQSSFVLPSGNIGCTYTARGGTEIYRPVDGGPELSCDRVEPSYQRVIMGPRGPGRIYRNVGDASCCDSGPVLSYGQVWRQGPFTCESNEGGLFCRRDDGRGFSMARRGIVLD
jgi:hypothetical protein